MTIPEYISRQDEAIRPRLTAVYDTIRTAIPEAEERLSWGMPTFWSGRNLIHFAPAKKHMGIYPGPEAVQAFREELEERGLRYSKGAIQFPYGKIDLDLIRRIAVWCGKQAAESCGKPGIC